MFDFLNVENDAFEKVITDFSKQLATVTTILIEKGIVTEEEYAEVSDRISKFIDESVEKAKQKKIEDLKKEFPLFSKIFDNK